MNPFHTICISATEGSLKNHVNAAYWASPEFRARVEFNGDQGLQDRVNITLFMLKSVALDPKYATQLLEKSSELAVMHINFFGVSNPFPIFYVPVGSQYHLDLLAAIKENMESRMFHAANRVRHWRDRSTLRSAHERAIWDNHVAKHDMPTPADYKINREAASKRSEEIYAQIRVHVAHVRDLRNTRLAMVSQAASPGVKGWTDFLVSISENALTQP